jgi:hypothetical protein
MIRRLVLIFSIIIFINVYAFFLFFLGIDIFTEFWRLLKNIIGPFFSGSVYLVSVLGLAVVSVVAFLIMKLTSKA